MNKRSLYLFFLLISAVIYTHCNNSRKTQSEVQKFTIRKVNLRDQISQSGEVKPLIRVELKSEASGKIERIYVKEGQRISKGDTILTIDPSRLYNQLNKLDLSLKKSKIDFSIAKRNYDNAVELVNDGAISQTKLQDLKLTTELCSIECQQQQLEIKDIKDQLDKTVILSPMNGVITSLLVEEGEIAVSATSGFQSGTSIGTIADISKLEVVTTIGEVDYVKLHTGQKVTIKPEALEGTHTHGTIDFIALSARKKENEELSGFEVRITIDSLIAGIAPGINVNVEFIILQKDSVLGIPCHFVNSKDSITSCVMMITDEKGKETDKIVNITTGQTDYRFFEIISGLKEGDVVLYKSENHFNKE